MSLAEDFDAITLYTSGRQRIAFLIDTADYESVGRYKWYRQKNGYLRADIGYGRGNKKAIRLHQFIMGKAPMGLEWDHINRDKLDNRRGNLRIVTRTGNLRNKGSKGVYRLKTCARWEAYIGIGDSKKKYLGLFDTEDKAIAAREAAKVLYWGTDGAR